MHNSTYSNLQSSCDNNDKLLLFSKIILAKVIYLGAADTQYIRSLFQLRKKKYFQSGHISNFGLK